MSFGDEDDRKLCAGCGGVDLVDENHLCAACAADLAATRAAQALAILEVLEKLPPGSSIYVDRTYRGVDVTVFTPELVEAPALGRSRHHGSDVMDALSQAATCLLHEGAP